jgi:hypothetical protein
MKYYRCIKDLIMNNGIRAFAEGRNYGLEGEIKLQSLTVILNDQNQAHALTPEVMVEHFETVDTEQEKPQEGAE